MAILPHPLRKLMCIILLYMPKELHKRVIYIVHYISAQQYKTHGLLRGILKRLLLKRLAQ